jgi:hypothetical protein
MLSRTLSLGFSTILSEAAPSEVGGPGTSPPGTGETVTFQTHRGVKSLEFTGTEKRAKKLIKDHYFDAEGHPHVELFFRNGEHRDFRLPESLLLKFAAHGAEQKLGDNVAGTPDVDDMVVATDSLIARLMKGEWSAEREGGFAGTSVLMKALTIYRLRKDGIYPADPSDVEGTRAYTAAFSEKLAKVKEFLADKDQNAKLALRGSAQLKPIVEELEAEKLAKAQKVDTDALLASL